MAPAVLGRDGRTRRRVLAVGLTVVGIGLVWALVEFALWLLG